MVLQETSQSTRWTRAYIRWLRAVAAFCSRRAEQAQQQLNAMAEDSADRYAEQACLRQVKKRQAQREENQFLSSKDPLL